MRHEAPLLIWKVLTTEHVGLHHLVSLEHDGERHEFVAIVWADNEGLFADGKTGGTLGDILAMFRHMA